jgi:4-hydroxy-tetrahydrodipicolinate reductase
MLASTNFSIGVNLYWKVAAYISKLFQNIPNYKAGIVENHHIEKKDAPSGTAITLAEKFLENQNNYTDWNLTGTYWMEDATNFNAVKSINELNDNTLPIISIREPNVPGTHQLYEIGTNDFIKLEHQANNRKGFAEGAVIAAEWLFNKKGVFSMSDMLKFEE